jgi:hypothetical protein
MILRRMSDGMMAPPACCRRIATTPATWGAAMLVPDIRAVPPPGFSERMPTDEIAPS